MQTKTLEDLLNEANELIPRLSYEETIKKINNEDSIIIDVREESEVFNQGIIKDAIHIPRGCLNLSYIQILLITHLKLMKIQTCLFIVQVALDPH